MPKRRSMKGMGADAFFEPASQATSIPVSQPNSIPVHQPDGKLVLVKATFYLTPEHILRLERLRLERIQKGEKIDKSALVREAIDKLTA